MTEPLETPEPDARTKQRILRHRAEQLASLASIEAFSFLAGELEKKRERMRDALMGRVFAGESMEVLQRQVDYDRGFIDGMNYPARVVTGAVKTLDDLDTKGEASEPEGEDGWSYGQ